MLKKEVIWREILIQARKNKKTVFTQKELATDFDFSLSTVFHALKSPRISNIISVSGRNFRLDSYQKLLHLWATERRLQKDFLFSGFVPIASKDIESSMPPFAEFGLYSAFSFLYKNAPADYDHIYVYVDNASKAADILKRLPGNDPKSGNPNFFILKKDPWFLRYKAMPPEQIFVDVWNAPEWYAKDFLKAIEENLPL